MREKILGAFIVLIPVLVSVKTGDLNYLWSEFAFVVFAIVIQPSVIEKAKNNAQD